MRILQVNKFNYIRGGAEKYFIEISKALEDAGHDVAIFSMHHPKNITSPWEKYFVSRLSFNESSFISRLITPFRIIYSFEAKRKFKKIINNFNPDIIHIHNIYHQISPSILSVARKRKIPVIMHLHDYKLICPNYQLFAHNKICFLCFKQKYYNCLKTRCFKNSFWKSLLATIESYFHHKVLNIYKKSISHFIAPSQFMKETVSSFSWDKDKIELIYNFPEKLEFAKKEDLSDYGLYFGRLSEEKGIDILFEALSIANKKIKIKIVGSGPAENKLKKMVEDLNLSSFVEFLGPKFGDDLHSIIRSAKIVFLPSIWLENMPLVLLESLAMKKVVAVSRTGGLPELIKDKENGFLFTNSNIQELAEIINNIDNYNLIEMGEKAYQSVIDLNIDNHLKKLVNLYQRYV